MSKIAFQIRFDGIGQTIVCARSPGQAADLVGMFTQLGKTNIVVQGPNDKPVVLGEVRGRDLN